MELLNVSVTLAYLRLQTNKFFHNAAPWRNIRNEDAKIRRLAQLTLFLSAESVRIITILLQPFMPERMQVALDMLQVPDSKRTFQHAYLGADLDYGTVVFAPDGQSRAPELFPKLLSSF